MDKKVLFLLGGVEFFQWIVCTSVSMSVSVAGRDCLWGVFMHQHKLEFHLPVLLWWKIDATGVCSAVVDKTHALSIAHSIKKTGCGNLNIFHFKKWWFFDGFNALKDTWSFDKVLFWDEGQCIAIVVQIYSGRSEEQSWKCEQSYFFLSFNSRAFEVILGCLLVSAFSFVLELAVTWSSVSFLNWCWPKVNNHDFIYSLRSVGVFQFSCLSSSLQRQLSAAVGQETSQLCSRKIRAFWPVWHTNSIADSIAVTSQLLKKNPCKWQMIILIAIKLINQV